jgi:4-amino-4-deoxy-L-arabinose transferase-like glycosyltransferase
VIRCGAASRAPWRALLCIAALMGVRAVVAAQAPLAFDEAYYWLWSKSLATGYLDHPPLIAYVIRLGTTIFGDTPLGVRAVPLVLLIAATWAVWRSGAVLLGSEAGGATAALFFNVTLMSGTVGLAATPDSPAMAAAAFFVLCLAKVAETERPAWWLAAGMAGGFALLSKYTAPFLGAGALLWLCLSPRERRWLRSPWPYLGAALALVMFAPVIAWNAAHGWISFAWQFGRVVTRSFSLRYLGDFAAGQVALATPFILVLGLVGVLGIVATGAKRREPTGLVAALLAPAAAYFVWHSLHARVQGNWPSFLYPAFCIAAAWPGQAGGLAGRLLRLSRAAAVPTAVLLTLVVYVHAFRPLVAAPGSLDPVARILAVGYGPVVDEVETLRRQTGAKGIVTTNYAQTGWLAFYMPSHPPVVQLTERDRWHQEPPPAPDLMAGPVLYVTESWRDLKDTVAERFTRMTLLARISRFRGDALVEDYLVYRADGGRDAR